MGEERAVVFVVDDDASMREALEDLVNSVGLEVRVFGSPREFLDSVRPDAPGCLVLDVRLPGISGLAFQQQLAAMEISLPVIFITGHGDIPMSVRAMKAGAVEFLTKPFRKEPLCDAVRVALARDGEGRKQRAEILELRNRLETLTPRERQVLALVVTGLLNKQIAGELGTTDMTVKAHRGRVMRKMGAGSLADLVRMAEKLKISAEPGIRPK